MSDTPTSNTPNTTPDGEEIRGPDGAVAQHTGDGWTIFVNRCFGGIIAPRDTPRETVAIAVSAFMLGRQVARRETVAAALRRVHEMS